MKQFKAEIEACKTPKQVMKVLAKYGKTVQRDNSNDVNTFSIWIDDSTRIYKPCNRKTMILQTWSKVKMEYSGIPTFFG